MLAPYKACFFLAQFLQQYIQHFHLYRFSLCSLIFTGFNRITKYIQPCEREYFGKVFEFFLYHPLHQKATNTATNKEKPRASVLAVAHGFSLQLSANKRPKAPPPEDIPVRGSLHRDLQVPTAGKQRNFVEGTLRSGGWALRTQKAIEPMHAAQPLHFCPSCA